MLYFFIREAKQTRLAAALLSDLYSHVILFSHSCIRVFEHNGAQAVQKERERETCLFCLASSVPMLTTRAPNSIVIALNLSSHSTEVGTVVGKKK